MNSKKQQRGYNYACTLTQARKVGLSKKGGIRLTARSSRECKERHKKEENKREIPLFCFTKRPAL